MMSLIKMGSSEDAQALDYDQPPIAAQLAAGARSLEFDVAYDPKGGLYKYPAGASMAGELPLNGTCVILMPSAALNASVTNWYELPEVP